MWRSSFRRLYHDSDQTLNFRTGPRYNNSVVGGGGLNYAPSHHRRSSAGGGGAEGTSYRILCQEVKVGSVIGRSGRVINAIERTGARINVHELIPGDEERVIEIFDNRRQDLYRGEPEFYPTQEALILIHDRILEIDVCNVGFGDHVNTEFEPQGGGGNGNRVITRLVVPRMHVGSLLGRGGTIMERMKIETHTHIRVLPTYPHSPRCVATSEEIVQVVGDKNAVKHAIGIISTCLRESQHHYGNHFHNRLNSPLRLSPTNDALIPHTNSRARRSSVEGPNLGSEFSSGSKSNITLSHSSGDAYESGPALAQNAHSFSGEGIVFRILCPADKVDTIAGESDGIVDLLRNKVGVDVKVSDPVDGTDEHVIIISSDEDLDDAMFPAQEALMHIQTCIVDIVQGKENFIITRLLLQSDEAGCLQLKDGMLSAMRKITGANIQILPKEDVPLGISGSYEIVQELLKKDLAPPSVSSTSPMTGIVKPEAESRKKITSLETHAGNNLVISIKQNITTAEAAQQVKDVRGFRNTIVNLNNSKFHGDTPIALNSLSVPAVNESLLEVVIPTSVASKLVAESSNKFTLISHLSGADVELIEDRPEVTGKIVQITGDTTEQTERAHILLQGFISNVLQITVFYSTIQAGMDSPVKLMRLGKKDTSPPSPQRSPPLPPPLVFGTFEIGVYIHTHMANLQKLEVILTTTIDKLGKAGESVRVAPGYFRNHLMPKLFAFPTIDKFARLVSEQRKMYQPKDVEEVKEVSKTEEDRMKEYQLAANRLDSARLSLRRFIIEGKGNELRHPVTKEEILAEVTRQLQVHIEPENLQLPTPLSSLGEYEVPIHLPKSVPNPQGKVQWTLSVKVRKR
ncbi:unnamed protein product [Fraxinus pennsylvanica]|uniref:Large ribosomal subunit protein bL9c n=1 Tax=Fraxinus pennsylvanica TaxID=56036 RepID=A0AAD1Z7D3_9LAMI|nr:unnamed protein product [Fraxinus pennsylvanica]